MSENNLPDAEKLLAGIPRKPCASSDPLAEIERLTKERDRHEERIVDLAAQNGRLRADLEKVEESARYAEKSRDEARAEVDRLRERLGPYGLVVVSINGVGHYVSEAVAAEIERLTKERDNWFELFKACAEARDSAGYVATTVQDCICDLSVRATAAEKSRDEALAELNKALETLGQLTKDRDESTARAVRLAIKSENLSHDLSKAFEAVGQLRSDLAESQSLEIKMCEERDAAEEMVGQMYHAATGYQPLWSNFFGWQDALEEMAEAAARAQSAEASLAKLREAVKHLFELNDSCEDEWTEEQKNAITEQLIVLRSLLDEHDKDKHHD